VSYYFNFIFLYNDVEPEKVVENDEFVRKQDPKAKKLTANITDIDENGKVTVTFSENLDTYMFDKTNETFSRFLRKNLDQEQSGKRLDNSSYNISDVNSSMIEMYVMNDDTKILIEPQDAFNFTWQMISLEGPLMHI